MQIPKAQKDRQVKQLFALSGSERVKLCRNKLTLVVNYLTFTRSFFANFLLPNNYKRKTVSAEKLQKTLLNEKAGHKMLVKLYILSVFFRSHFLSYRESHLKQLLLGLGLDVLRFQLTNLWRTIFDFMWERPRLGLGHYVILCQSKPPPRHRYQYNSKLPFPPWQSYRRNSVLSLKFVDSLLPQFRSYKNNLNWNNAPSRNLSEII